MNAYTDAIAALNLFNSGTYKSSNPYGYSGTGGMDANWVPTLRAVATVAAGVAAIGGTIASSQSTLSLAWDAGTTDANPGAGKLRGDAPPASATYLYISTTDSASADVSAILAAMGASTSSVKGRARLVKTSDSSVYADFSVTGVEAATGYYKVAVTYLAGSGSFSAADAVALGFVQTGWKGDTGDAGTQATESTAGAAKIATQAETNAATNDTDFVTPLKLDTRLTGTAIRQGKHVIAVLGGTPETTNGAAFSSIDLSSNKQKFGAYLFDSATTEYLDFLVPMPSSWDEGTLTYKVYWRHGATTNFDVAWSLQAVAVGDGDTLDASMGAAVTVADTGGDATKLYISAESSALTVAGSPQAGDLVMFRLSRAVADVADTMAIDAAFICAAVFVNINSAVEA